MNDFDLTRWLIGKTSKGFVGCLYGLLIGLFFTVCIILLLMAFSAIFQHFYAMMGDNFAYVLITGMFVFFVCGLAWGNISNWIDKTYSRKPKEDNETDPTDLTDPAYQDHTIWRTPRNDQHRK